MATEGAPAADDDLIEQTERWFLRRGIPHFIHRYRASEDVFTRVLPTLGLIFVLEILGAANLEWPWYLNLAALVAAAALIVAAWAVVNRWRGRRWSQPPDDVGVPELAAFVLFPAVLPLIFGGQVGSAAVTVVANLTLLGAIYLVASYGLVSMTRWAYAQTTRQVGTVVGLFGRALPLLLLFSVALFINAEMWQVAASLAGPLYWSTVAFIVGVGLLFLLVRLPGEVQRLSDEATASFATDLLADSPLRGRDDLHPVEDAPLSARQRGNVLLVLLFSQAVQVALVTATMAAFFFAFGVIAIRPEAMAAWLGDLDPGVLAEWRWFGYRMTVTRALVHTAGFLGILSGFYFTVYVITDATYRSEFFTEIVDELRESLAVRQAYLALVARAGSAS